MIAMVIQNSPEKKLTLSEVGHFHMRETRTSYFLFKIQRGMQIKFSV